MKPRTDTLMLFVIGLCMSGSIIVSAVMMLRGQAVPEFARAVFTSCLAVIATALTPGGTKAPSVSSDIDMKAGTATVSSVATDESAEPVVVVATAPVVPATSATPITPPAP